MGPKVGPKDPKVGPKVLEEVYNCAPLLGIRFAGGLKVGPKVRPSGGSKLFV